MPNKHFCQGPFCHEKPTTDRFLKSKGIIRGRYARLNRDYNHHNTYYGMRDKYFCSLGCESQWLAVYMEDIEHGRPIPFIRERRISEGFEKKKSTTDYGHTYTSIEKIPVDNDNENDRIIP